MGYVDCAVYGRLAFVRHAPAGEGRMAALRSRLVAAAGLCALCERVERAAFPTLLRAHEARLARTGPPADGGLLASFTPEQRTSAGLVLAVVAAMAAFAYVARIGRR